ncbi:hypothetical protein BDP27DRAFT_1312142 [Rhodocollybia butyracea]|uniref:Transmembrane protein n=1 Tax=Rhodocollybia butyracea TaxID=206335 RepID=A0A9P5QBA7_9AGAR|nr:hypothetical protein BDP27DRAFT_1312142 [Rhodocollybia butyracea]
MSSGASSFSTSATSTQTAAAASSSPADKSNGFASQGVHYFFGFLVTFIVLLSFFICCGFSRRRFAQRRALAQFDFDHDPINFEGFYAGSAVPPTFYETPFVKGDDSSSWFSIQPLSAGAREDAVSSRSGNSTLPPIRHLSPNPHATIHGLSLPIWTTAASENGHNVKKDVKAKVDKWKPTVMQVAVVITMPGTPKLQQEGDDRQRHLEIGVTCEPWDRRIPEAS